MSEKEAVKSMAHYI